MPKQRQQNQQLFADHGKRIGAEHLSELPIRFVEKRFRGGCFCAKVSGLGAGEGEKMHVRSAVLGLTAVLVLVSAGAAQSLSGENTVNTGDIKDGEVYGRDLHDGAVTGVKVKDETLTGSDVKNGSLSASDLKSGVLPDLSNYFKKSEVYPKSDVYTKSEVDALVPDVSNFYTKSEVDALVPEHPVAVIPDFKAGEEDISGTTYVTVGKFTVNAPAAGTVVVNATAIVHPRIDSVPTTGTCTLQHTLALNGDAEKSNGFGTFPSGSGAFEYQSISISHVFAVTAGPQTITVRSRINPNVSPGCGSTFGMQNPTGSAVWMP